MIRLVIAIFLLLMPIVSFAQSEFSVRIFGSTDDEAPSTPVITSVIPTAYNQIDVTWSTSTDNFLVFGYVVIRDGLAIATTTAANYSDTGLTASTTYSYEVRAFDTVPNYSSSSVAVATTTPGLPPVISTAPQSGTVAIVVLDSLTVDPGVTSATLDISVRMPARIEVRIGETTSYETGYFVGGAFIRDHTVPVNDLRPNTTYFYEIIGYTPLGKQTLLSQGSFTTNSDAPPLAPTNVQSFAATTLGNDAVLTWELPADFPANARVRVVRSHLGFPAAINDGIIVYEGVGTAANDAGVFGQYDIAYYTAFVIDPDGSISSGAIAIARSISEPALPGDLGSTTIGTPEGQSVEFVQVPPDPNMPDKSLIQVWQEDLIYSFASTSIELRSDLLFTVAIPASAVRGSFKTIVASLTDPRDPDKSFSFLLRLNAERTMYLATIAPVFAIGDSDLIVEIYDYDARVIGNYHTTVTFVAGEQVTGTSTLQLLLYRLEAFMWAALLAVPFIVLFFLWFIFRRRDEDKEGK